MLVGPSTLLNLLNSAANAGLGGCVSDGRQKEKQADCEDAHVVKLASDGFSKAIKKSNKHIRLYFETGS